MTFAGSFGFPGIGDSHGPSVSDNSWLMLTISATILKCCNFSITAGIEKKYPESAALFTTLLRPVKQCRTTFFSELLASISMQSASASRV